MAFSLTEKNLLTSSGLSEPVLQGIHDLDCCITINFPQEGRRATQFF